MNIPTEKSTPNKLLLCGVYLPSPIQKHFLEHYIDNANRVLESNAKVLILGDFNLSGIAWNDTEVPFAVNGNNNMTKTSFESTLLDFIALKNLTQYNTTVLNHKGKILDLVLSNLNILLNVTRSNSELSSVDDYHPPLEFTLPSGYSAKLLSRNYNERHNFYKADFEKISNYLSSIPWESDLASCTSVDEMNNKFYSILRSSILKYVPKSKPASKKFPPWYTRDLIHLSREKYKLRMRYKKYNNPLDELAFRTVKKRCSDLTESCYLKYITDLEKSLSVNPKKFWTFLKSKKVNSNAYPSAMTFDDKDETCGTGICNLFASYFASVYRPSLPLCNVPDLEYSVSCFLGSLTLRREDVLKTLKGLDRTKGAGPDGIPSLFVVQCCESLSFPLTIIFNESLMNGVFPSIWKEARIVPVFKSGDSASVKNYRAISILSVFGKAFESLVCPVLSYHIKHLISPRQSGFLASRSTVTNLIPFVDFVSNSLGSRIPVDTIYTDFSKAFDSVDHKILLGKLSRLGVYGSLLEWFKSYLYQRKSHVVVNGYSSHSFQPTSGVPQGSHLGPILFNIFINDIVGIFDHVACFLYADDMKLSMQIRGINDSLLLQEDLDRLAGWCRENRLYLNTEKCVIICSRCKTNLSPSYNIAGQKLQEVDSIRDLGVIMDKKLRFHKHIDQVATKGLQMLGFVLRNAKEFKKPSTKILLYLALVRSGLKYCSQVWSPHYEVHIKRIERIQKRFFWHLSYQSNKAKLLPSYKERLAYFKMTSLQGRRLFLGQLLFYKIINGLIDCPALLRSVNFNIPYKLPRRLRYVPFSPKGAKSSLGHHATMNRLQRQYNVISKSYNIDIFSDKPLKFRRKLGQFLESMVSV
ncbi:unnamed protein product [Parnassius mnemosyne]|uniref:Reverse transcriptase domain-containing protein n=1 Tax=Parnassius mnemosyne TaxID=213953 RepID=A0AAV1MCT2_9NEOP